MKYTNCPICNKQITNPNFKRHVKAHDTPSRYLRPLTHDGLDCQYCGKTCKNKNSLAQHEIRCSKNDTALKLHNVGNHFSQTPWNKGLTKETDSRVAKNADSVHKTLTTKVAEGWKPFFATDDYWTAERRAQRSKDKIQLFKQHPEKHPNRILASNSYMTYPEQVAAAWLSKHNIEYIFQYKTCFEDRARYVDFYLPTLNIYIEIDGEYWHKQSVDQDVAKDLFAKEIQGIITYRIRPKLGVETQLSALFEIGG